LPVKKHHAAPNKQDQPIQPTLPLPHRMMTGGIQKSVSISKGKTRPAYELIPENLAKTDEFNLWKLKGS